MNKAILMGRLTRDPETRYTQGEKATAITKYSLAVNRSIKRNGEPDADFLNVVAFGKAGEFADKYFKKGQLVCIVGRIQTGSYTNKDGQKVYTTDIIVEEQHFAEKNTNAKPETSDDGFVNVSEADELPYN